MQLTRIYYADAYLYLLNTYKIYIYRLHLINISNVVGELKVQSVLEKIKFSITCTKDFLQFIYRNFMVIDQVILCHANPVSNLSTSSTIKVLIEQGKLLFYVIWFQYVMLFSHASSLPYQNIFEKKARWCIKASLKASVRCSTKIRGPFRLLY